MRSGNLMLGGCGIDIRWLGCRIITASGQGAKRHCEVTLSTLPHERTTATAGIRIRSQYQYGNPVVPVLTSEALAQFQQTVGLTPTIE